MSRQLLSDSCALGIDGGGTKTLALIVDARGRVRGEGCAGSSNQEAIGITRAALALRTAAAAAAEAAGCALPVRAAWVGLAGVDRPADAERWQPHLTDLSREIRITNDAELLLGALPGGIGLALIAGTGSTALGRNAMGRTARAGGWGHLLGDEGSGYDIGRQALQAVMRAADGRGPRTLLGERILAHWQVACPEALLSCVYPQIEKGDVAALAALVLAVAREGDGVAQRIVREAARELALAALAVAEALSMGEERVALAVGGGLLVHQHTFRSAVVRAVRRRRAVGSVVVVERPALSAARAALARCAAPATATSSRCGGRDE
jgi:N-acetylglucosamine kinase-like BadF-type ATPase